MNNDKYINLIYKALKGDISAADLSVLKSWEALSLENKKEAEAIRNAWNESEKHDLPFDLDYDQGFEAIQSKIKAQSSQAAKVVEMPTKRRWLKWVASVAVLLVASYFTYNALSDQRVWTEIAAIDKVLETKLPDGSIAWINVGSTLSYPQNFEGEERNINLKGEAFFEVKKNPEKPFIINTGNLEVKVLGTAFNVRDIENEESAQVVVREGKVSVKEMKNENQVLLSKSQKVSLNKNSNKFSKINKGEENTDLNEIAWQRKSLKFTNIKLSEAIDQINQFYQINISIEKEDMRNCEIAGRFKTSTGINKILKDITNNLNIEIEKRDDKNYTLMGGICK